MKKARWLVGITGGIAAYKIPELVRLLIKQGAEVRVVMSQGAGAFVTPLTLQALSQHPVYGEGGGASAEAGMDHIELARWAENVVIAPLSANRLAALAMGMADDLLTTLCLATQARLFVVPAMNQKMWEHPATQHNIRLLEARGTTVLLPAVGEQACGEYGLGRMPDPEQIMEVICQAPLLKGLCLLITAGPTRESIDPVRFVSNRSSGKMGFALAQAAAWRGASVILIAGPVDQSTPAGVERINVESAEEMAQAVRLHVEKAHIVIGVAAVADFRPETYVKQKIKKAAGNDFSPRWVPTTDIMGEVATAYPQKCLVGFAAETDNGESYAKEKLQSKNMDLIAFNDVSRSDIGFDSDDNALTVFTKDKTVKIAKAPKIQIAFDLLTIIKECYDAKNCLKDS